METKLRCACCGYRTIERIFEICPVCFWQQDSVQEGDVDDDGGPNNVSLREAINNFRAYGASEERFISFVREPYPYEII